MIVINGKIPGSNGCYDLVISGLVSVINADGRDDETMTQACETVVECEYQEGKVVRVKASGGIIFRGATGTLTRPDYFDVTDLCDLPALTNRVIAEMECDEDDKAFAQSPDFREW